MKKLHSTWTLFQLKPNIIGISNNVISECKIKLCSNNTFSACDSCNFTEGTYNLDLSSNMESTITGYIDIKGNGLYTEKYCRWDNKELSNQLENLVHKLLKSNSPFLYDKNSDILVIRNNGINFYFKRGENVSDRCGYMNLNN